MADNTNQTTETTEAEAPKAGGVTTTIASAYSKATAVYDHIMAPVRAINEYVDSKNDLDHALENGAITEEKYNEEVQTLQTNTFGEDTKRLAIANKFEAVADWKEAHGIDKIEDGVHDITASIKDAFAKTSLGQKFAEIKAMAAEMGDVQHEETEAAEAPTYQEQVEAATADLPADTPSTVRETVYEGRQAAQTSNAMAGDPRYEAPAAPNAMAGDPRYAAPATPDAMTGDARYAAAAELTADIQMDGTDGISAQTELS